MNDRFKFRVWNKARQCFMPEKEIFICGNGELVLIDEALNRTWVKDNPNYAVYLCTGLKDKNGKLIYEGDVLRYPPKEQNDEKNYVACEVFFHNNDCCDNHIGFQMNRYRFQGALCGTVNFGTKYKFIPKNTEKMEVIGNIYENKELLDEQL